MKHNRGSEWRKWDLHVHTASSYDYKNKSITNDQFIKTLITNEISVIAITDHHIIDSDRIKKLQKISNEEYGGKVTILPGIEFLSETRGSEPIHFIGIFPENADLNHIWGQIENKTNLHQIKLGKAPNEVYCKLEETVNLIHELGGLVSIHAGNKDNSVETITNSLPHTMAQKSDIAKVVDIYELGRERDQQGYREKVFPAISKKLPMIICSDNHDMSNYKLKQNCWIKAEPSFEGLKQIIYEPEQRVKIQSSKPDVKDDKEVISYVQFKSDNKKFNTAPICLNPNLNVIIGGKSSGKSILLYSIAKTLSSDNNVLNKDDGSERYNLKSIDGTFDFTVFSQGGVAQSMYGNEQHSIIPNIKHIPQNYLVKLAEPELNKKGKSLNKIVRDLIKEDGIAENKYSSFISTLKRNDEKREVLINRYFALSDELVDLNVKIINAGNPEVLKQNIQKNTKKVEQLNIESGITEKQQALYKELQAKQEAIAKKVNFIGVDYNNVCEFFTRIESLVGGVIEAKLLLEKKLKDEIVRAEYEKKLNYIDEFGKLTQALKEEIRTELKADNKNYFIHDNIFRSRYAEIQEEVKNIDRAFTPFHKGQEKRKQVKSINDILAVDKKLLGELNNLINQRKIKEREIVELQNKIFELYGSTLKEYIDIIKKLEYRTTELKSESLKIQGVTKFNFAKFQDVLLQISNKRYDIENKYPYLLDSKKNELSDYNSEELIEEMKVLFEDIVKDNYVLSKGVHKKEAIKKLLDDYFYDYWQVSYKNDKLGNMSTGKASFVILMLIIGLSKSKSPILIDQPEDNLDNRSITKDLIGYLRAKKLERQIILVTHNANIVVNSDAENIIVANQRGQDNTDSESEYLFDYVNGPIENTFPYNEEEKNTLKSMGIREHIAEIVEGGKEAFKLRELKYQF